MRLLLFLSACFLTSCISYKPVMITGINNVKTDNFSGEKAELSFNAEINNPNGFKIVLKQYDLDVMINDKSLGNVGHGEKVVIKRRTKTSVPMKMSVNYKDFLNAAIGGIGLLTKAEPVTFKVKGGFKGRAWWFRKNFPVDVNQKIKL